MTKTEAINLLDKNGKFTGNPKLRHKIIPKNYYWCRTWSDYIWSIINNITAAPICKTKECNNITKKYGWKEFRPFCSSKCSNSHIDTTNKVNKTNQRKYGVNRPCENGEIYNKLKLTNKLRYNCENVFQSSKCMGYNIKDYHDLSNKDQYYKMVWKYTKANLNKVENIDKRGVELGFSLDHKYSISQGFRDNILPHIIGSSINLEIITIEENSSKGGLCKITKDELFNSLYHIF